MVFVLEAVFVVVAGNDLGILKLCIGLSHYKNLTLHMRSSAFVEVSQFLVIFSFVLVIFAHFRQNAYFSCESSYDLYAQIVFHRYHIGKAVPVCVFR